MPTERHETLTKIVATVGPACNRVDTLVKLIEGGVRVLRINFSHGSFEDFENSLRVARQAADRTNTAIGVFGDLSGPKIRVTTVDNNELELHVGDHVEINSREGFVGRRDGQTGVVTLACTYDRLVDEVEIGHRLLINDGAIRMLVTNKVADNEDQLGLGPRLICNVLVGGPVSNKKGINLPDTHISAPALTDWDEECAAWAVENELDYLAMSFVRRAADLERLHGFLESFGRSRSGIRSHTRLPIIAKIEKPQAIDELEGICDKADAIMVARGDLGVEMDLAEVPVIQKRIIRCAHDHSKPVIVATQMLQSMIDEPVPTRAEVSDCANAILDGADAVMLSGETAVGRYPDEAVSVLTRTARFTEDHRAQVMGQQTRPPRLAQESRYRTAAIAHGVSTIAKDLGAHCVVTWSELGGSARYLSQNRLTIPIVAVSSNQTALRQMALHYGVVPVWMPRPASPEAFLQAVDQLFLDRQWVAPGDPIVICRGDPIGTPGVTNQIRIHYVGDVCRVTWRVKGE